MSWKKADLAVLAAVALPLVLASSAWADVLAAGHELVVLAEPAAPALSGESGPVDLTLTWTLREVFAGEPSSVTVAVRHRALEPSQVKALSAGGRWVVLADRDPDRPGRWTASMPLRATPTALAAFREWSAPPDVRPERDLGSVVAEVRGRDALRSPAVAEPPATAPAPVVEPVRVIEEASRIDDPTPAEAEGPVIVEAPEPPPVAEPARPEGFVRIAEVDIPADLDQPIDDVEVVEEPAPIRVAQVAAPNAWRREVAAGPVEVMTPLARDLALERVETPAGMGGEHASASSQPPLTWQPALAPERGPGLPPPPPSRPLGPPLSQRKDLKKAK